MNVQKQKKYCKDCTRHHTGGIKNGIYDNWCTKFSGCAAKKIGHCINVNGKVTKTNN